MLFKCCQPIFPYSLQVSQGFLLPKSYISVSLNYCFHCKRRSLPWMAILPDSALNRIQDMRDRERWMKMPQKDCWDCCQIPAQRLQLTHGIHLWPGMHVHMLTKRVLQMKCCHNRIKLWWRHQISFIKFPLDFLHVTIFKVSTPTDWGSSESSLSLSESLSLSLTSHKSRDIRIIETLIVYSIPIG